MKTISVVFFGSLLMALVITPLVVRAARRLNLVDTPDARKIHADSVPRIGGVAIVIPVFALSIPVFFLDNRVGESFRDLLDQIVVFLVAAAFVFLVGLVDDVRGLRARTKFAAQLLAAGAVCASGTVVQSIGLTKDLAIDFGVFAIPFTLLWIVGVTNAVNLIDGLDGLAAGISAITCAVIAGFAVYQDKPVMAVIMMALLGSLCGFLVFNFNPARIFMGDSGSLFLGFMLATSSVLTVHKTATVVALALPMLALGIPIFDTLLSMIRRALTRRSMFAPDRDHIHHRLLEKGLHHRQVVLLMYGVTALVAALGVVMTLLKDEKTIVLFIMSLVVIVLVFRVSGAFQLRRSLASFQQIRRVNREAKEDRQRFETMLLEFRDVRSLDDWWRAMETSARALGVERLDLARPGREGGGVERSWLSRDGSAGGGDPTPMHVSISSIRDASGAPLELRIAIGAGSTFESCGRRLAMLCRLIDEYPPPSADRDGPAVKGYPRPAVDGSPAS